ncbi:GNAT family N-acetyltransferase [Streptomyces aureoversilis]|uniref:GNAT family N-acetyltransferase n=1 Tax=Streptomyces aureoversilis TaxID=67277 RepID=A0ABW0A5D6_9ACTN
MIPADSSAHTSDSPGPGLLDRLEGYYDSVPRSAARAEDFGPLTLFVREGGGWPYYARPSLGPAGAGRPVSAADVLRVRARQRELGLPESFEWVAETTPALRAAAEEAGLTVHEHPLMVLEPGGTTAAAALPEGLAVRLLGPDDPALPSAVALGPLAFSQLGTAVGTTGTEELAAAERLAARDGTADRLAARIRAGLTVAAAAVRGDTALCSGMHQPVGAVTELVGIGTLPAVRRQGLGLAVTAALVADARSRGAETVFLSAGDDDVARIYARAGFRRAGTALIAEPAEPEAPRA